MTRFIVRVELHYATEVQYQKLHELMAAQGLLRYIVSADNRKYWLPPAEYTIVTAASRGQVLAAAKVCAASVVPSFAVVVTEAAAVQWEGLQAA